MRPWLMAAVLVTLPLSLAYAANLRQTDVVFQAGTTTLTAAGQKTMAALVAEAKSEHPSRILVEGRAADKSPKAVAIADQRAAIVIRDFEAGGIDRSVIERHPSFPPPGWESGTLHQVVVTFLP